MTYHDVDIHGHISLHLETNTFAVIWNFLTGLILGLGPANERRRYFVTCLIGWGQTWNQPWFNATLNLRMDK